MGHFDLQQGLAAALHQEGQQPQAAEQTLRRLLDANPSEPLVLIRLARLLHRMARTGEAILLMSQAARTDPKPSSFNDLGSLYLAAGDAGAAIDSYRQALRLDPRYVLAGVNLADTLSASGRVSEAIDLYRQALSIDATSVDGQVGLAVALLRVGENASAMAACKAALEAQPGHVPALHTLAIALAKSGDKEAAIAAERTALARDPKLAKGWHTLGNLLDETGSGEQAAGAYQRALDLDPALVEASFDLAALSATTTPPAMPRTYVTRLFDDFAPTFERRLVAELDYRVPEKLREAIALHLPLQMGKVLEILDLGCGTGLVGRQFRDVAKRIIGVDLSPGMLKEAEVGGDYEQLICEDVVRFISTCASQFDLILAADLFIYIGDLEALFAALGRIMRARSLLGFSIETVDEPGFILRRTRRYAHSLEYIGDLAIRHSFELVEARQTPIRRGDDGPVDGHVIILRGGR